MTGFIAGLVVGAAAAAAAAWWKARRQAKRMGRFFSFAAHEINSPITAVNMTIINLLSGVFGPLPADQVQWMEMMREQVARLSGMVGELRDLIHIELHRDLVLQIEDVPAQDVVDGAERAVALGCANAGVPLEKAVEPGLPKLRCDADRAQRSLTSMLFHARKFRSGGPVRLSAAAAGPLVRLEVEFQAGKLTAEEAARSLDLFYPADAHGHGQTATGLGLGILRAVARLQGGDFQVKVSSGLARLSLLLPAIPS